MRDQPASMQGASAPRAAASDVEVRRRFWIEHMERSLALMQAMTRHPVEECGEAFASIPEAARAAGVEMRFSDTLIGGRYERLFVIRESLIEPLLAIGRAMLARGWMLMIEEGYRTRAMQASLACDPAVFERIVRTCTWECGGAAPSLELLRRRSMCLVAQLPRTGTHLCGCAVDISVFERDTGREVWRGARYLDMDERTPMASPFITAQEQRHRREITGIMETHGFMHYPGEFWHYNQGDALDQILNHTGRPARFGPVDWDPQTNRVQPFDDPDTSLITPEHLEAELTRALLRMSDSRA